MGLQRYVSDELTHFAGRGLREEEQYSLLVDKILKPGWLKPSNLGSKTSEQEQRDAGLSYRIDHNQAINDMYLSQVVCFCDIPEPDLKIHMHKYSKFGLSFPKPFLVGKGASPVFYVAKNANSFNKDVEEPWEASAVWSTPRERVL